MVGSASAALAAQSFFNARTQSQKDERGKAAAAGLAGLQRSIANTVSALSDCGRFKPARTSALQSFKIRRGVRGQFGE